MIAALAVAAILSGGAVRGVVVDAQTSAPLADVQVAIGDSPRAVVTGADGTFAFDAVSPGEITLALSRVGYIFVTRRVAVAAGAPTAVTIALTAGTGPYQERVTVSATMPVILDNVVTLGSADLQELRGIAADDPVRALQALPGVATGDDFQAEFSVRGSAFRHVGFVIDGTPTAVLTHAVRGEEDTGSISMINTDVLARASLSAGPQALRHGDWIGATVEFDIREGSRDRAGVRGAVSGTFASIVLEGPLGRSKRGSWLVSTRRSYIDWLVRKIDPDVDSTIGFVDAQAKAAYDLTSRQQLQVTFVGGNAAYRNDDARTPNQVLRASSVSTLGTILWRYTATRAVLSQRVSAVDNHFRNTGFVGQEGASGGATSVAWRGDAAIAAFGGAVNAGVRIERQRDRRTQRDFAAVAGGGVRVRSVVDGDSTRRISGVYVQFERSGGWAHLDAGVRVSHDTLSARTEAQPWLAIDRERGRWRVFASAGRAVQFPPWQIDGTHDVPQVPESARGIDGGAGFALSSQSRVSATVFYRVEQHVLRMTDEDRLVNGSRVPATAFAHTTGSLNGSSRGAEVVVRRQAPAGLTGWVAYTWARTRYDDTHTGERFDGDFDQRHTLNVFAQQRLSFRTAISAKLRVGSNFPVVGYFEGTPEALRLGAVRNAVRLPVYARLDLRGTRTFTFDRRRLTLFVELMNVTGRRNLGLADGVIRTSLAADGYVERLLPFVPSAGILIEF